MTMRSRSRRPCLREPQPAELIVLIGIRAGEIEDTLRIARHHRRQRLLEMTEERLVGSPVREADVQRPARLPDRIVVLLVHRKREHARIGLEDERGAVAVVDVQIDDGDALDAVRLQNADRHGDIVERTESFAVIREGVVQSAADVNSQFRISNS